MELIDLFRKRLKAYIKSRPRGAQSHLADELGIERRWLNDFLAGRKTMSEDLRERIANHLGYKYEDFIAEGRSQEEKQPPPISNVLPMSHESIIHAFRDQEAARNINAMLLELEREDNEKFRQAQGYITALFDAVKAHKKTTSSA